MHQRKEPDEELETPQSTYGLPLRYVIFMTILIAVPMAAGLVAQPFENKVMTVAIVSVISGWFSLGVNRTRTARYRRAILMVTGVFIYAMAMTLMLHSSSLELFLADSTQATGFESSWPFEVISRMDGRSIAPVCVFAAMIGTITSLFSIS